MKTETFTLDIWSVLCILRSRLSQIELTSWSNILISWGYIFVLFAMYVTKNVHQYCKKQNKFNNRLFILFQQKWRKIFQNEIKNLSDVEEWRKRFQSLNNYVVHIVSRYSKWNQFVKFANNFAQQLLTS